MQEQNSKLKIDMEELEKEKIGLMPAIANTRRIAAHRCQSLIMINRTLLKENSDLQLAHAHMLQATNR